jgi:glycosyltransferase involved in cell wall biosynthesis
VIPAHNAERFLEETLRSALDQTHECSIIVVDDVSTDRTPEIARSFGQRIRLIQQANARQAAARNTGVRAGTAPFIAFLDADDLWEPSKLSRQMDCFEADPGLGLAYCSIREIDVDSRPSVEHRARLRGKVFQEILLGAESAAHLGSTCLIRRDVFEEAGGFDPDLPPCEDTDLFWRVASRHPVDYVDDVLVGYRIHPASAHKNLEAMTVAWQRLYRKALADPRITALGAGFGRRCRARLNYLLAGEHALNRQWAAAAWFLAAAALARPSLLGRAGQRLLLRLGRHDRSAKPQG